MLLLLSFALAVVELTVAEHHWWLRARAREVLEGRTDLRTALHHLLVLIRLQTSGPRRASARQLTELRIMSCLRVLLIHSLTIEYVG